MDKVSVQFLRKKAKRFKMLSPACVPFTPRLLTIQAPPEGGGGIRQ